MADSTPAKTPEGDGNSPQGAVSPAPSIEDIKSLIPASFPPEAEKALEKVVEEGGPKALMAIFGAFSRTTSFGPDPQTAKVMADVEMHAEDCRLKGYQETLKNRDTQGERDHKFRNKKLNHETVVQIITLTGAIIGAGIGLYLYVHDNKQLGGYVLFGSFFLIYNLVTSGKTPSLPKP